MDNKNPKKKDQNLMDFRLYKQKINILSDGICHKIVYDKRSIKENMDILLDEEKDRAHKKNILKKKAMILKRSQSQQVIEDVSPYARKMLEKIDKHIKQMKDSTAEITKMNGLYLEKSVKNSSVNTRQKTLTQSQSSNIKKNENLISNFAYVNENYRKQLNSAFLRFNPVTHIENMKILLRADPTIKNDIVKLKKEVEEDVKIFCDKHYYRKKYERFMQKNRPRSQSVNPKTGSNTEMKENIMGNNNASSMGLSPDNENTGGILSPVNEKALSPDVKSPDGSSKQNLPRISKKNLTNKSVKKEPLHNVPLTFMDRVKRKEQLKLMGLKEQKAEELVQVLLGATSIGSIIDRDTIKEKIDECVKDYGKCYYANSNIGDGKQIADPKNKNYFENEMTKIDYTIGNAYIYKLQKDLKETERLLNDKVISNRENYSSKMSAGRLSLLKEIQKNIDKNKVNLGFEFCDKDKERDSKIFD